MKQKYIDSKSTCHSEKVSQHITIICLLINWTGSATIIPGRSVCTYVTSRVLLNEVCCLQHFVVSLYDDDVLQEHWFNYLDSLLHKTVISSLTAWFIKFSMNWFGTCGYDFFAVSLCMLYLNSLLLHHAWIHGSHLSINMNFDGTFRYEFFVVSQ